MITPSIVRTYVPGIVLVSMSNRCCDAHCEKASSAKIHGLHTKKEVLKALHALHTTHGTHARHMEHSRTVLIVG